jgi:hypothetical protein
MDRPPVPPLREPSIPLERSSVKRTGEPVMQGHAGNSGSKTGVLWYNQGMHCWRFMP